MIDAVRLKRPRRSRYSTVRRFDAATAAGRRDAVAAVGGRAEGGGARARGGRRQHSQQQQWRRPCWSVEPPLTRSFTSSILARMPTRCRSIEMWCERLNEEIPRELTTGQTRGPSMILDQTAQTTQKF